MRLVVVENVFSHPVILLCIFDIMHGQQDVKSAEQGP